MHCFTLFLCWGVGVSGNYATFATYRVLTFNKHIYGSQEIAESGPSTSALKCIWSNIDTLHSAGLK